MSGLCEGRVVVITGAGRGIGREHALEFARQGADVVVNDLGGEADGSGSSSGPAEEVAQEVRALGRRVVVNGDDVSTEEGAERLIRSAVEELGGLDVLVNNAGILRDRMLVNMTFAEWDDVIRVHLRGTFAPTHFAAGYWREPSKAGDDVDGRVINTSSSSGIYGNAGQTNYGAAKAGIASFTIISAMELGRYGVTVNAIAPGAATRLTIPLREARGVAPPDPTDGFDPSSPDNVAPLVVWLGSAEARGVTGQVFNVHGGRISVAEGWRPGPSASQDHRWDPEELGAIIPDLVAEATPPFRIGRGVTAAPSDWADELRVWLEDNWDPELTVGEWWERLGMSGWSAPLLPADAYGRGLNRADALVAARIIRDHGALGAPVGMGIGLVAPTMITHGTREQIDRFLPDIVTGKKWWCQLFSEPGAGSDLAGLGTRAERDGDQWIVNGQKVWTSGGHWADLGMLIARTNPGAPKHQGISWFAFDMHQPGADVRPMREMTGGAMFCEVFLSDAVVSDADRIGDVNNGWQVANTTLFHERSGMGAGGDRGVAGAGMARAGTVADDLSKRAGDFVRPARKTHAAGGGTQQRTSPSNLYIELARATGQEQDPAIRQGLVHSYILTELQRLNTQRHKAVRAQGGDIPGLPNFSKLLTAHILRHHRDLGLQLLGARGMLHGYDPEQRATLDGVPGGKVAHALTGQALQAQALPIFGGTDQIQRNIIGERVLGLPKEPGDMSRVPWNELPRNG